MNHIPITYKDIAYRALPYHVRLAKAIDGNLLTYIDLFRKELEIMNDDNDLDYGGKQLNTRTRAYELLTAINDKNKKDTDIHNALVGFAFNSYPFHTPVCRMGSLAGAECSLCTFKLMVKSGKSIYNGDFNQQIILSAREVLQICVMLFEESIQRQAEMKEPIEFVQQAQQLLERALDAISSADNIHNLLDFKYPNGCKSNVACLFCRACRQLEDMGGKTKGYFLQRHRLKMTRAQKVMYSSNIDY